MFANLKVESNQGKTYHKNVEFKKWKQGHIMSGHKGIAQAFQNEVRKTTLQIKFQFSWSIKGNKNWFYINILQVEIIQRKYRSNVE